MSQNDQIELYRKLVLIRLCEEKIREEYAHNEMKTPVHLGVGAEAISLGVVHCLPQERRLFGSYRNHALYLSTASKIDEFFGELYGKVSGSNRGKAGSMHLSDPESSLILTSAVVATPIPIAVGTALALRLKGQSHIPVSVFFGDGAIEEGVFYESLNFACLHQLNIIFVCEDNGLAIHTHKNKRQSFSSLRKLIQAYPCDFFEADGRHLLEVIQTTQKALETSRPRVLHFHYTRFLEHVGPREDFHIGYRSRPSDLEESHDPVTNFERVLKESGVSDSALSEIGTQVQMQVQQAVQVAKDAPFPERSELWNHVYASKEPNL